MTAHVQTSFCNWKQSLQCGCRDSSLKRRRCRACCELVPEATFKVFKASFQLKKKWKERKSCLNTQSRVTGLGDWKWRFGPRDSVSSWEGVGGGYCFLLGVFTHPWSLSCHYFRGLWGWMHRSLQLYLFTPTFKFSQFLSLSLSLSFFNRCKCSGQEQCSGKENSTCVTLGTYLTSLELSFLAGKTASHEHLS